MKHLLAIQKDLKANKSQYNSFGGFHYRSAEDILEAVKPLLAREGCVLCLSDEIKVFGEGDKQRFYIEATATLITPNERFSIMAYAREDESKKGMDGSQITGTASSYARKYALNGLFCIDDAKDADTDEHKQVTSTKDELISKANAIMDTVGIPLEEVLKMAKVKSLEDLDKKRLMNLIEWLNSQKG